MHTTREGIVYLYINYVKLVISQQEKKYTLCKTCRDYLLTRSFSSI